MNPLAIWHFSSKCSKKENEIKEEQHNQLISVLRLIFWQDQELKQQSWCLVDAIREPEDTLCHSLHFLNSFIYNFSLDIYWPNKEFELKQKDRKKNDNKQVINIMTTHRISFQIFSTFYGQITLKWHLFDKRMKRKKKV